MDDHQQRFWFPAKRYGWGWGPPVSWQGWLVLLAFLLLALLGVKQLAAQRHWLALALYLLALSAALIATCWLKGETPRWRWGEHR